MDSNRIEDIKVFINELKDKYPKFLTFVNNNIDRVEDYYLRISGMDENEVVIDLAEKINILLDTIDKKNALDILFSRFGNFEVEKPRNAIDRKFCEDRIASRHSIIYRDLASVADRLNKYGIDYYMIGALSCYFYIGHPLIRLHDDIDFLVNVEDIDKLKMAMSSTDYDFFDMRHCSEKRVDETTGDIFGPHEVIARHKVDEFHIGFIMFRRGEHSEVITQEYYVDLDGKNNVYERYIDKELSSIIYADKNVIVDGISIPIPSIENIYIIKKYLIKSRDRWKDMVDIGVLCRSGCMDFKLVKKIEELNKNK